ncbi:hypothetical protein ACFYXS_37375 [Streptomyces sp. NPDC002574]|uniref:hypothetical protein n=1 Tax=Streptomyces sp. NPDC002574 TaxID=3364652 RepID=UPI0036A01C2B
MTTDAWQQTRAAALEWWRRVRPAQADQAEVDLEADRARILTARRQGNQDVEQAVTDAWHLRLHDLLVSDPAGIEALREFLEEQFQGPSSGVEPHATAQVIMRAEAKDSARMYMAGRDQHITET